MKTIRTFKGKNSGFSLVEIIVVIAIIGILAAILVPALLGYIKDSKFASANSNASTLYSSMSNYCQKCASLGYDISGQKFSKVIGSYEAASDYLGSDEIPSPKSQDEAVDFLPYIADIALAFDADGSYCMVEMNDSGFPMYVIWAKTENDIYVGAHPASNYDMGTPEEIAQKIRDGNNS